jgi:hypothetical protein
MKRLLVVAPFFLVTEARKAVYITEADKCAEDSFEKFGGK